MESRTATDPTSGTSPSLSYAELLARRAAAARVWCRTGRRDARNAAIDAHNALTAHPQHRP